MVTNDAFDDDPSTELATKLFTWIQKVHRGFLVPEPHGPPARAAQSHN